MMFAKPAVKRNGDELPLHKSDFDLEQGRYNAEHRWASSLWH
jgi:hypothetical protein